MESQLPDVESILELEGGYFSKAVLPLSQPSQFSEDLIAESIPIEIDSTVPYVLELTSESKHCNRKNSCFSKSTNLVKRDLDGTN